MFRVVICGTFGAGKRSLATRLRGSLSSVERSATRCRGSGVEHSYVDVRRADGALQHTVEFLVVDHASLLSVALPSAAVIERSTVVVVADVSNPTSVLTCTAEWTAAVNKHVLTTLGDSSHTAMAEAQVRRLGEWRKQFADFLPPEPEDPSSYADFDICNAATVCAIPITTVISKMDLADRLPNTEVALTPSQSLPVRLFLLQAARAAAIEHGSALGFAQQSRGASHADTFFKALVQYLVALCQRTDPSSEQVCAAIGFDFMPFRLIAAGVDSSRSIWKEVAAKIVSPAAAFPESIAAARVLETHQAVLQAAMNASASPGRIKTAPVKPTSPPPAAAATADDLWDDYE